MHKSRDGALGHIIFFAALSLLPPSALPAETNSKAQAQPTAIAQLQVRPIADEQAPVGAGSNARTELTITPAVAQRSIVLQIGVAREISSSRPFTKVVAATARPEILDILPINDRNVILQPLTEGKTNIFFLDEKGAIETSLDVTVDKFIEVEGGESLKQQGYIEVHNKAKLNSQTNFRCEPKGCTYTGEVTVQEPAPLPIGHSEAREEPGSPAGGPAPQPPQIQVPQIPQ